MAQNKTTNFDVFMAHNSQDKQQVEVISKKLKERGLKPWLDKEQIAPGRWFQDVMQAAIPSVKSAAIFIGPKGLGRWQALELRSFISQCVENGIPVIPVLLPGVDRFPDTLPFLKELHGVRFKSLDDAEALDNLEWGISGTPPKQPVTSGLAPAKGKLSNPKSTGAKKSGGATKAQKAVTSSGDWVLLDGRFYEAEGVTRNSDGSITLRIASIDAKDEAAFHALDPVAYRAARRIGFAYGNDGLLVKVKKVEAESRKGSWLWSLTLTPEQIHYGGGHHESSYQGPEGAFTAEEIAELRAQRILMKDPPKKKLGWSTLETLICGGSSVSMPAEFCVIRQLYAAHGKESKAFLEQARLAAILALKGGDVVERVLELSLGPVKQGKVYIKFKGVRGRKYDNVEPTVMEVDGDCPLE